MKILLLFIAFAIIPPTAPPPGLQKTKLFEIVILLVNNAALIGETDLLTEIFNRFKIPSLFGD